MNNGGDPWDQNDMDTGLEGLDDESDVDEDAEETEQELGSHEDSHGGDTAPAPSHSAPTRTRLSQPRGRAANAGKYRLRAMGPKLARLFPKTRSLLITQMDGSQVLFVRKG